MECEQFKALIDDYIDGTLPQAEGEALKRHLAECGVCREEFDFVRMLASDLSETTLEETPPKLTDDILEQLPRRRFRFLLPWGLSMGEVAITAAAILLVIIFSILFAKHAPFEALSDTLNSFGIFSEKIVAVGSSLNEQILALGQHPEPLIIFGILGLALLYVIWTEEDYEAPANSNSPKSLRRL